MFVVGLIIATAFNCMTVKSGLGFELGIHTYYNVFPAICIPFDAKPCKYVEEK